MAPPESTTVTGAAAEICSTASRDLTRDHYEMDCYLDAADELQKSMPAATLSDCSSALHEFRNILLSHASSRIESEWLTESTHSEFASPEFDSKEVVTEGSFEHQESNASTREEVDLIPSDAVHDLRRIAELMAAAGHLRECIQLYAAARSTAVDASLMKLGVEKLSIADVQRLEWETLEKKIRRWTRAAGICVRVLFAGERRLCQHIFQGLGDSADDACFVETIKASAHHLFNFADAISTSNRSPEKLFKILDLHDALSNLSPDINTIFDSTSSESIRSNAAEIISKLAEAATGIFSEFENAILLEQSKIPVPGGTIHPLTRYVMNYISLISDYKKTLIELIVSKPSIGSKVPDMDLSEFENESQCSILSLHLIWIIATLQFNLDNKSKHYKDTSLSHLFIMNNFHYIVQKIKGTPELREMIGDEYLRKLTGIFRSAATSYQRATWVRVLYCLRDEGLHMSGSFSSSGALRSALRERFKAFNAMFEEVHRTQATWLVPDNQLREELRISISERIIPAYRSFLGRFRIPIERGKHPQNYIKYSVEDLEDAVLDFFEGYSVSSYMKRRCE